MPKKGEKLYMVLAGNYQQFLLWQKENPDKKGRYVTDQYSIKGFHGYIPVRYGTWYERENPHELEEELEWVSQP